MYINNTPLPGWAGDSCGQTLPAVAWGSSPVSLDQEFWLALLSWCRDQDQHISLILLLHSSQHNCCSNCRSTQSVPVQVVGQRQRIRGHVGGVVLGEREEPGGGAEFTRDVCLACHIDLVRERLEIVSLGHSA
uniref:Uncharacterized protein n=1 Tax=Micrurus spixii TaxID=129469 RepID=A0A2D4MIJ7_9SAUR